MTGGKERERVVRLRALCIETQQNTDRKYFGVQACSTPDGIVS